MPSSASSSESPSVPLSSSSSILPSEGRRREERRGAGVDVDALVAVAPVVSGVVSPRLPRFWSETVAVESRRVAL